MIETHVPTIIVNRAVVKCHDTAVLVSQGQMEDEWKLYCEIGNIAMNHALMFTATAATYHKAIVVAEWLAKQACELNTDHAEIMEKYSSIQEWLVHKTAK